VTLAEAGDKDKDVLRTNLRALAAVLGREARGAVESDPRKASLAAGRYEAVQQAIAQIDRNAAPAFAIATMIAEMQRKAG
jgi:hypothetical protein